MSYAILPALESKIFSRVVVSTDSPEYAEIAKKYGAEVPFLRPADLAEDVPTELVIKHALRECERIYGEHYYLIVTLQATTPLMTFEDIKKCVDIWKSVDEADSSLTIRAANEHPEWFFRMDPRGILHPLLPGDIVAERGVRQALGQYFVPNGAVYVTWRETLLERNRIIGSTPVGVIMPQERSVDIDCEEDFKRAEEYLARSNRGD